MHLTCIDQQQQSAKSTGFDNFCKNKKKIEYNASCPSRGQILELSLEQIWLCSSNCGHANFQERLAWNGIMEFQLAICHGA